MKKTNFISALKAGVAPAIIGLTLVASPAMAQEAEADDVADADDEAIVVTGTRITNPNLELSTPVGVVTSEELTLRQTATAEQFLRELPSAVPSIGSAVNNGNGGASFVNLRGIGSNRNLVLLDGRRVVPSGVGGVVDLNNIPLAVIERTDILTSGAVTTYGADAISGVVNFITKDDFSGLEANLSQTITEEGDGNIFRAELTIGANFDDGRGNAVLSVGYQDQDEVFQGDRAFSVNNINSFTGAAGGSGNTVPSNLFFAAQGPLVPQFDANGVALLNPDGSPTLAPSGTALVGQVDPAANGFAPGFSGGAGPFNFNPFNIFQTPFERFNIYSSARYEVSDALEVFSQAVFSRQTVETIIAPGGSFFNTYAINLNNPFINDGVAQGLCGALALSDAACTAAINTPFGATLADGSDNPDFVIANGLIPRRSVEAGTRNSSFQTTVFNIAVGARGGITDSINWEVSGTYGESDRVQTQTGFARFEQLQNSLIAIDDGTGTPVCTQSAVAGTTVDAACVPLNLFGELGSITQEQIDFVFGLTQSVTNTSTIATVNGLISGDFGGFAFAQTPVSFAVGAEYREFNASRTSDEASQTPGAVVGGGGAAPDIDGAYDVFDIFGELAIPLFEGEAFAESLTIDLGARYSDYSTAGTEFTWKAGGTWEPFIGLKIRGNYARSSRAPNIGELFAPVVTNLGNLAVDPCAGAAPVGDAALTAVCLAQGAPVVGSIPQPIAGQINITTGGNPDLGVETADTWNVGIVAQPSIIPGLSVTVDYFNIILNGAVSAPATGDIIGGCFDGTPDINDPFCQLIDRNPTTGGLSGAPNELLGLLLNASNLGRIETDGIDLSIRYGTDLTDDIGLNLSFDGTWTNENRFQALPTSINRDCIGFFSVNCGSLQPEFTWSQRTTLTFADELTLSLRWRFLSSFEQEPLDALLPADGGSGPAFVGASTGLDGQEVDFGQIPSESYFDLSGQWDVSENVLLTVTVTNLFDNQPSVVGSNIGSTAFNSGNIFPSTFDALGRRFSAAVRFSF